MQVLIGDNRATLATLPAKSVHCCVTSPPYWGLRSYLSDDHPDKHLEIGSEQTPDEFIAVMVETFRAVRRVLRDDGLLFINLGDSYATTAKDRTTAQATTNSGLNGGLSTQCSILKQQSKIVGGMKDGDMAGIPWRVALAIRDDGWYLRDAQVWHKGSPMPTSQNGWRWVKCRVKVEPAPRELRTDSVARNGKPMTDHDGRDFAKAKYEPCPGCKKCQASGRPGYILRRGRFRTTTAHEFVFMFSKSKHYFCDAEACKEIAVGGIPGNKQHKGATAYANGDEKHRTKVGLTEMVASEMRLPRSVFKVSNEPYKKGHFATFPSGLPRRCIEMATSEKGCCPACGAQYAPVVETKRIPTRPGIDNKIWKHLEGDAVGQRSGSSPNLDPQRHIQVTNVLDHWPTCGCDASPPVPAVVLDCFGGSGTTAQAAQAMGRDWILCELNESYVDHERINTLPKWAINGTKKAKRVAVPNQRSLFDT